jgi:hypothetical protein
MSIVFVGIDLTKNVFAVHGVNEAQLSMLLEGIDWRMPTRTWQPHRPATY